MVLETKVKELFGNGLHAVKHTSFNRMYVGYSEQFSCEIFIKIYREDQYEKFITEKEIIHQKNIKIIGIETLTVSVEGFKYMLILEDLHLIDVLKPDVTVELAFQMGKSVGDFHANTQPFKGIRHNVDLIDKIAKDIDEIKNAEVYQKVYTVFQQFQTRWLKRKKINYLGVLHGDVGVRNFKWVKQELVLIDFERAQFGLLYLDFVKLFYQDFDSKQIFINAFLNGYKTKIAQFELDDATKYLLIFSVAVGIFKYVDKIKDISFEKYGETMLKDVEKYLGMSNF